MNAGSARIRVAVVFNPRSGPGRRGAERRRRRLMAALVDSGADVDWADTTAADPGRNATCRAVERQADLVLVCGGDGTVMDCAAELLGTSTPLAIVPGGTGNIIATSLGVPRAVHRAVAVALGEGRKRVDVCATSGGRHFFAGSVGVTAEIMREASQARKNSLGMIAYVVAAARHLFDAPQEYAVVLPGGDVVRRRANAVLVGNYASLVTSTALPSPALDDGLIEVGFLRLRPNIGWLRRAPAEGDASARPLEWLQAERIEVSAAGRVPSENDGDYLALTRRWRVSVRARALTVCVPLDAPARRRKPLALMALRDLLLLPAAALNLPGRTRRDPAEDSTDVTRRWRHGF